VIKEIDQTILTPWKRNFPDLEKIIIKGFDKRFYSFFEQKDKDRIDSNRNCKGNNYYANPNHDLHQLGFGSLTKIGLDSPKTPYWKLSWNQVLGQ
jgi:hypothetical protein